MPAHAPAPKPGRTAQDTLPFAPKLITHPCAILSTMF